MANIPLGDDVLFYPNPASDWLQFVLPANLPSSEYEIKVFDALGRPVSASTTRSAKEWA
ncbi:MAG: T9SS type A sorting domain-containing protein [Lewinellaceae bacterium]|nr:T9SS type A sorting domain-containing protein [Lewinellaceae bacterium]